MAEDIKTVCILGDITDAKDYHSAKLVNDIVTALAHLTWLGVEIKILMGNHDYLLKGQAYLSFLNHLPGVQYYDKITEPDADDGPAVLFLPHTKTPAEDWKGFDFSHYNYVFLHQTIKGAIASNGMAMDGEPLPDFKDAKVYSGDIHVPQVIGGIEYVGSPYHVHFGDSFKPRCVLLDRRNRPVDLHFKTIRRFGLHIRSLGDLERTDLRAGDQVTVRVKLESADKHDWRRIRRELVARLDEKKVELIDVKLEVAPSRTRLVDHARGQVKRVGQLTDAEAIQRFVENEDLGGDALDAALWVIE